MPANLSEVQHLKVDRESRPKVDACQKRSRTKKTKKTGQETEEPALSEASPGLQPAPSGQEASPGLTGQEALPGLRLDDPSLEGKKEAKPKAKSQLTSMRVNLKATKDELKDKDKKLRDVENKFSAWRKRHPTKGLTMEFISIDPTDTEK